MNILFIILGVVSTIVLLLLLTAALIKKEFLLEKNITINKPKRDVFNYLKLIRNQEYYSVWVMKDPNVKLVYTGIDGSVGFKSSWESNDRNVGIGEQEIIKIEDDKSIEVEIRFKKPFEGTNWARTTVSELGDSQTKITNTFFGKNKFPINLMNLMMDKMIGKDLQQNLLNMKTILEK